MEGFYKYENEYLMYAKDSVGNNLFTLTADLKDTYIYPVHGWRWFDTFADAAMYYNLDTEGMSDEQKTEFERLKMVKMSEIVSRFLADMLHDELLVMQGIYEPYEVGRAYKIDELFRYENNLYRVIQAHTSQADWKPDEVPALYAVFTPVDVIADWVQPTGSHDTYQTGDRVRYNEKVYESVIDNNSWSPDAYPAGWKLV